nr:hypothetical protein [Tanacetum cinerariifolium]
MTELPLVDSYFVVLVFYTKDNPIACLNKEMYFLIAIASTRQTRVVKGYNCQGDGHMARQCTKPKRPRNETWYKDKSMLAKAQEAGQVLDEEQLTCFADPRIPDGQAVQTIIPNNNAFQTEDLDTYDSDKVPHSETYPNDMENQMHMLTKPQGFYDNIHKQALGYQNPFYLKKAQWIKPTLYDGIVISNKHVAMHVIDDEETLILEYKCFVPQQELSADETLRYHMLNPSTKSSVALRNFLSSGPGHQRMTPAISSSGLILNPVSQQPCIPPNRDDWDHLFQPIFDEYFNPPTFAVSPVPVATTPRAVDLADSSVSTSIDQDAPSTSVVDPTLFTWKAGNDLFLLVFQEAKEHNDIEYRGGIYCVIWVFRSNPMDVLTANRLWFPLYCDNKSEIAPCCNNVQHLRAKLLNVCYHFIKEQVENGIMELYFRTFAALINKSLSGKTTGLDKLCLSRAQVLWVSTEAPTSKSKRVKRHAKKSTETPTRGVVIRETPKMPLSKKKEKMIVEKRKGINLLSEAALTEEAYEGTCVKPRVLDVAKEESMESEVKSWGNVEDDSNNEQVLSDEDRDQDDDKTQPDNKHESNSEYETDKSESDLEQIHKDDLEEIDLKWQLVLLCMRAIRFFQKTGNKITINGSDTVGYDKAKVECFNCYKMRHFARECRVPRNQENVTKNQETIRRKVNVEGTSSKAMVAIDEAGFDWSYMADDEATIHIAFMTLSDSETSSVKISEPVKENNGAPLIEDWESE